MPPPRKRIQFTQELIDQQLQQIHLLDPSSATENLEQLGPIIKQIHDNRQQDAFLRTLQGLIESKEGGIEKICSDNYQEFVSSVSTLFSVKSYTTNLREKITTLDSSVSQLGRGLVEKKKTLLQSKKTAANLDEAIDTLQACLRALDVVNRVGEMVKDGKYWSALRSLEEIQNMPAGAISQTPLLQHLLSSLPSLRGQIKDAVTASTKQWLLEIRNISGQVGKIALEAMEARARKWRLRREKDPSLRHNRVGSAVEVMTNEKAEFDVLDNDRVKVDFKPLYECLHIYTTLDHLDEFRKSYQADRKAQSDLILPSPLPIGSLPSVIQEITGFFIIETNVLNTTGGFRSERDVEELWEAVVRRLSAAVEWSLKTEVDPEVFLRVKEILTGFLMTMDSYAYPTNQLQSFILALFEKHTVLLEKQFSKHFDQIIQQDDYIPMHVNDANERESVLTVVWLGKAEQEELRHANLPLKLPWSQSFYFCCQDIRSFVAKFYQFIEGVSQHQRNIDELLGNSIDKLLSQHVSENINKRLTATTTLSQIAQMVTNLEHFQIACSELERSLTSLRSTQRGGTVRITAVTSFSTSLSTALARISGIISSKLDDFFELSEYNWTPDVREDSPSMYLYELVNWLTTVVDGMSVKEAYKDEAYRGAVIYIADCWMEFVTGRSVTAMNDNALSNILQDINFLESELTNVGREHLATSFFELRSTISFPLNDNVAEYLQPSTRQSKGANVKSKRLQSLLEKLVKGGSSSRDSATREKAEKRRKEAEQVGRLYPG